MINNNINVYVQIKNLNVCLEYKRSEGSVHSPACRLCSSDFDTISFIVILKRRCVLYNICASLYLKDESEGSKKKNF